MDNLLEIFIAVTAIAVLIQAGILVALFVTVRKSVSKMEAVVEEVKIKTLPSIHSVSLMVTELKPKVESLADDLVRLSPKLSDLVDGMVELKPKASALLDNAVQSTDTVKAQLQRIDATMNDAVDRARLQVIRADEMLTRTFDRVEHTSDVVTKTVVSPVRQVSGIVRGVTAGVEFLMGQRGKKNGDARRPRQPVPQDEMFI